MMNFKTLSANNYSRRRFPRLSVNLADYDQGQANLADLEMQEGHEPAKGSRVTVILKVYGSNGNNSGSIQEVILHDNPPKFYCKANSSQTESQLEALGITRSASPYTQQPTIVAAPDNNMEEDFHNSTYSGGQNSQQMQNNGYRGGYQNQQPNPYMQYGQQNQQVQGNGGYNNGYQNQNNSHYQPDYSNYQQQNQNGYNGNQTGPYNPNNDPNRRY